MDTIEIKNKNEFNIDFISDYTVVDIETTGLSNRNDDIIEISALKIRNNQIIDKFSSLAKPKQAVKAYINKLTGISNEMLANAPEIEKVLPEFVTFAGHDILLGHNIKFDMGFLRAKCLKILNCQFENKSIDTCLIAKRLLYPLKNHKLKTIAEYYNISTIGHHRALNDCYITFEIYKKLMNI